MSSFNAFGVLFAFGIATTFMVFFLENMIWGRFNSIVAGVVGGVRVSPAHRRSLFYRYYLLPALSVLCYQLLVVLAWWVGLRAVVALGVAEEVRLFAYLCLFTGGIGALFLGYQVLFGYLHLSSELREAEAD